MRLDLAVDEFASYITTERGLTAGTVADYRRSIGRYVGSLQRRGVSQVAAVQLADVHTAFCDLGMGRSASFYVKWLAAVRLFHRFALREGWTQDNPAELVEAPRRPAPLPRPLTFKQVTGIVEAAADPSPLGLRDRAILELLYASGLRASEVVGLNVENVDLDGREVRCVGKGDKERVVPFGRPAAGALSAYTREGRPTLVEGRTTDALFLNYQGSRLSRVSCWHIVKRYAAAAAVEDVWPHRFRHSTATHMIGLGRAADLRVVQEILGHARLSTTRAYTAVTPDRLRWVIDSYHPRGREGQQAGRTTPVPS